MITLSNVLVLAALLFCISVAGIFLNRDFSYGTVMSWLAVGPIIAGILVYATFPESAHRELEELNPEDVVDSKPVKSP